MTYNTTLILIIILSGLAILVMILHQLRQVYKRLKSKSIMSKYPLTVAAILYKGMYKHSSNEKLYTIFDKRNKDYVQEEKERVFVSSVLKEYSLAISYLIGKYVFETETLDESEVHTIYSNRDRIDLIQTSEDERVYNERIYSQYEQLKFEYPNGIKVFESLYQRRNHINHIASKEVYIDSEHEIRELEDKYEETQLFKVWEDEQTEFTNFIISAISKYSDYYYHGIDYGISGYEGMNSKVNYIVCQQFRYEYCDDELLQFTDSPNLIQSSNLLEKFKNKTIDYSKITFNKTIALLKAIQEKYGDVIVFFGDCNTPINENIESNYKKLQQILDEKEIGYYELKNGLPKYIKTHYVVIIELYTHSEHLISTCESIIESFRRIPCITYISFFSTINNNDYFFELMIQEDEKERKQKERKGGTKNQYIESLRSNMSPCPIIHDLPCFSMYYYYPTTCDWQANKQEWDVRKKIWNFKYDPAKTSELEHKAALESVLRDSEKVLRHFFGSYTSKLTLVCIPASTKQINILRYEEFSNRLCATLNMINGYSFIKIEEDVTPKHLGGNGKRRLSLYRPFYKNKNILLFDDVVTSGRSIRNFKHQLELYGANVIGALTIGKTKHERAGKDPIYMLLSSNIETSDHNKTYENEDNLPF